MNRLEGANCADLPGFVVDKYFDCHAANEPLLRDVALAICRRCVVIEECRDQAFNGPWRGRGVIGGVTAGELRTGREWRAYELGYRDQVPRSPRPEWLQRPEAAETAEEAELAADDDEPETYTFDNGNEARAAVAHISQITVAGSLDQAKRAARPTKPKRVRLQRFNVDVPVPLPGASCADMPAELVDKYFNANVLTDAPAAHVAMLVCDNCVILDLCRKRALNGSNVRASGVIAGMGARELERGRLWRRYEQGARTKPPTSERPEWLEPTPAGDQFDAKPSGTESHGDSVVE